QWLPIDRQAAIARGFSPAYRRIPLRPLPGDKGIMVAIPYDQVQALIRELLRRITLMAGEEEGRADSAALNAFWIDWWQLHSSEARWYRSAPSSVKQPKFKMESGRKK
ncbi:MAG TPA: hypothetical protein VKA63_10420, partial [Candidatus Krumholzibacteria bacterium]|nr:hypothetical protein [Candidatus Krumholzibacteria bacterium]